MTTPRTIFPIFPNLFDRYARWIDVIADQSFQSSWSHPDVPLLIFADSGIGGSPVTFHGGPVGSGLPVEALFWGSWWLSPDGAARLSMISSGLQAIIDSPYFSELAQYGISPPHWRGAKVVTKPGAPGSFNSDGDQQVVSELIDSLIDDNVFPDPDDEQIAYLVFMPQGFTQTIGANGAHTSDYNFEFPYDKDYYWFGWVRWFEDVADTQGRVVESREDVTRTATHELVELLSDPSNGGWFANPASTGEICDLAVSPGTKQTAFVNGAKVTAYWSNRHNATVIPIDRDYMARLTGTVSADHTDTEYGTFRPDPSESRLCKTLRACCLQDKEYDFSVATYDSVAKIAVEWQRYRAPVFTWMIEGVVVSGSGVQVVNVIAETFSGRNAISAPKDVAVHYVVATDTLQLRITGTDANFDLTVSCSVRDGSIAGNLAVDVIAEPTMSVGFVGANLTVDDEYAREREACMRAAAKMFKDKYAGGWPGGVPHAPGPVEIGPDVLTAVPAYAGLTQYNRARDVFKLALFAHEVLPSDVAANFTAALIADTPVLQAALTRRAMAQPGTSPTAVSGMTSLAEPFG